MEKSENEERLWCWSFRSCCGRSKHRRLCMCLFGLVLICFYRSSIPRNLTLMILGPLGCLAIRHRLCQITMMDYVRQKLEMKLRILRQRATESADQSQDDRLAEGCICTCHQGGCASCLLAHIYNSIYSAIIPRFPIPPLYSIPASFFLFPLPSRRHHRCRCLVTTPDDP